MFTLSSEFTRRSSLKDTDKLIIIHIYETLSDVLRLASVSTIIDSNQYIGCIKNYIGSSRTWNLTGDNNVTSVAPKVELVDYQGQGRDFSIIKEFFDKDYYGKRIVIYIGYEGMSLSSNGFYCIFDGYIKDISMSKDGIEIECKNVDMPETPIQGRLIDFVNKKLGPIYSCNIPILQTDEDRYLPVPFGNHWNAPLILVGSDNGHSLFYAAEDALHSTLINPTEDLFSLITQSNLCDVQYSILLENDEFYTPLVMHDWNRSLTEHTYLIHTGSYGQSGELMAACVEIRGTSSNHFRTDEAMLLHVPMRYILLDSGSWGNGWITGSSLNTVNSNLSPIDNLKENAFHGNLSLAPFSGNLAESGSDFFYFWANTILDTAQLKSERDGSVRPSRKISIPSTTDFDDGRGMTMGHFMLYYMDHPYGGTIIGGVEYATSILRTFNYDNLKTPLISEQASQSAYMEGMGAYIGGNAFSIQGESPVGSTWFTASRNQNTRCFGTGTNANHHYTDWATEYDNVCKYGTLGVTEFMGSASSVNRNQIERGLGCRIEINWNQNHTYTGGGDTLTQFTCSKIYHLSAGSVDTPYDKPIYGAIKGICLNDADSLYSTDGKGLLYQLRRPYEYIEYLLRTFVWSTDAYYNANWAQLTLEPKWTTFFSESRDYSGFVIHEKTELNKFIKEYIQYEPFTLFINDDGKYNFIMLQPTYETTDIDGTIEFSDIDSFDISLTPLENVKTEIVEMKTDFMYAFDDYTQKINWCIDDANYDYTKWEQTNTFAKNSFKIDKIEKKYTSYCPVDFVSCNNLYYGCVRSNVGQAPNLSLATSSLNKYWAPVAKDVVPATSSAWHATGSYKGEDEENRIIAKYNINQWANRHRTIKFTTKNLELLAYTIGDIIAFNNVPYNLLGMNIKGFAGYTNFTSTINSQTVYSAFVITQINKNLNKIQIECIQLHNLEYYSILRRVDA